MMTHLRCSLVTAILAVGMLSSARGQEDLVSSSDDQATLVAAVPATPSSGQALATDEPTPPQAPSDAAAVPAGGDPAPANKPWTIPQPCCLQQLGINIPGGWLNRASPATVAFPPTNSTAPNATNDRVGEYQLNQL